METKMKDRSHRHETAMDTNIVNIQTVSDMAANIVNIKCLSMMMLICINTFMTEAVII